MPVQVTMKKLLGRKGLRARTLLLYHILVDALKCDVLPNVGREVSMGLWYTIKFDAWSRNGRSVLGVTCHWLDGDFQPHTVRLAAIEVEHERLKATVLEKYVLAVLHEWGLSPNMIYAATPVPRCWPPSSLVNIHRVSRTH